MKITIDTRSKTLEVDAPITLEEVHNAIHDLDNNWWMAFELVIRPEVISDFPFFIEEDYYKSKTVNIS